METSHVRKEDSVNVSTFTFVAKNKGLSETEYLEWQKLSYSVLNSARMMGLSESDLTKRVFDSALDKLTAFEVAHKLSFISLEMALDEISLNNDTRSCLFPRRHN